MSTKNIGHPENYSAPTDSLTQAAAGGALLSESEGLQLFEQELAGQAQPTQATPAPTLSTPTPTDLSWLTAQERENLAYSRTYGGPGLEELAVKFPLRPLLRNDRGQGMFTLGDMHFIKSQPGNGKTQACALLAVATLGGGARFGLHAQEPEACVQYYDTEMNLQRTVAFKRRVAGMMGQEPQRFWCQNMLHSTIGPEHVAVTPDRLWSIIKTNIKVHEHCHPGAPLLVIIDGVADLLSDTNDNRECAQLFRELVAQCNGHNTALLCVLHENQGATNGKMRGHAGSQGMRLAREVYGVKRSKDVFTLFNGGLSNGCKYTDGPSLPDVSWSIDADGLLVPVEVPVKAAPAKPAERKTAPIDPTIARLKEQGKNPSPTDWTHVTALFGSDAELDYDTLVARHRQKFASRSADAPRNFVNRCVKSGLLQERVRKKVRYFRLAVVAPEAEAENAPSTPPSTLFPGKTHFTATTC